jgi:hypothetical protein
MGHLRRFQCNKFVIWTYWHRPVALFPWRQQGRQSKHGQHGGNFGFPSMVVLMDFGALSGVAAKFDDATTRRMPACVLLLRGGQGMGAEGEMGE